MKAYDGVTLFISLYNCIPKYFMTGNVTWSKGFLCTARTDTRSTIFNRLHYPKKKKNTSIPSSPAGKTKYHSDQPLVREISKRQYWSSLIHWQCNGTIFLEIIFTFKEPLRQKKTKKTLYYYIWLQWQPPGYKWVLSQSLSVSFFFFLHIVCLYLVLSLG